MKTENLEDFYQQKFNKLPSGLSSDVGHFNVFRLEECLNPDGVPVKYSRRDFYKISMIRGHNVYHYADKSIEINGTALIFFNPQIPYTWETRSGNNTGYFCIFKEAFFTSKVRGNLHELPMFSFGGKPAYVLDDSSDQHISSIFEKMLAEINSRYTYKYDLLGHHVMELVYDALKQHPHQLLHQHPDANARLTAIFNELLERQFPIESPGQRYILRSPKDFAKQLAVHVNHLNRAIRQTTGKTTTELIAKRLIAEAIALLKHADWNISEIGYSLGFEEPSHFNNFFKKQTQKTPSAYRVV